VPRAHDGEVSSVERRDLGDAETLGDRDEAGVDAAEPEIAVLVDELRDARAQSAAVSVSIVRSPSAIGA
jgi:hypothetical protein